MRNESDIKAVLVAHLREDTPVRCQAITERTGAATPVPKIFEHPAQEPGPGEWPPCWVAGNGRAGVRLADTTDDGDDRYEIRYRFLIEVWALLEKDRDFAGVDDLRARLEQAIVESLFTLHTDEVVVDVQTISSRPSEVFVDNAGRQAQAVEISFEVISVEAIELAVLAEPPIDIEVAHTALEDS